MACNNEGVILARLDTTFDHTLTLLKPFYLTILDKQDKNTCTQWIKKLTDYNAETEQDKSIRNQYCTALYKLLSKKSRLEPPFSQPPTVEKLDTLPSYLFNDDKPMAVSRLPDWVDSLDQVSTTPCVSGDKIRSFALNNSAHKEQSAYISSSSTYDANQRRPLNSPYAASTSVTCSTTDEDEGEDERPYPRRSDNNQRQQESGRRHQDSITYTASDSDTQGEETEEVAPRPNPRSVASFSVVQVSDTPRSPRDRLPAWMTSACQDIKSSGISGVGGMAYGDKSKSFAQYGDQSPKNHRMYNYGAGDTPSMDRTRQVPSMKASFGGDVKDNNTPKKCARNEASTLTKLQEKELVFSTIENLERKTALLQAKFHEELLQLSRQHDDEMKATMDRKNAETDAVRREYVSQLEEQEMANQRLEKRLRTLTLEMATVREAKENELDEVKRRLRDESELRQLEVEHRIEALMTEMKREKDALISQHRAGQQEYLRETQECIVRMEKEYSDKKTRDIQLIKTLEDELNSLKDQKEIFIEQKKTLEYENDQFAVRMGRFQEDMEDLQRKYLLLEEQYHRNIEEHEEELKSLNRKHEMSLQHAKDDKNLVESRVSDTIEDLTKQVDELRRALRNATDASSEELSEKTAAWREERNALEASHCQNMRTLQEDHETFVMEKQKEIMNWQMIMEEKENEINRLEDEVRRQSQRSEEALTELRTQMELASGRLVEELKRRLTSAEEDLTRAKKITSTRDLEAGKRARLVEEEMEKERVEWRTRRDAEKKEAVRERQEERKREAAKHATELSKLQAAHHEEVSSKESQWRENLEEERSRREQLENQARYLKGEATSEAQLRKQQLVELGLLREEEKAAMARHYEGQMTKMRRDLEDRLLADRKSQAEEVDQLLAKTNSKLIDIENEYQQRLKSATQTINDMQASLDEQKLERQKLSEESDQKYAEVVRQHEEDMKIMRAAHKEAMKSMEEELDNQTERVNDLESQARHYSDTLESQLRQLRQDYETRLSTLMPLDVQKDLEETILSLTSQISLLQQRIQLMQNELETISSCPSTDRQPLASFQCQFGACRTGGSKIETKSIRNSQEMSRRVQITST